MRFTAIGRAKRFCTLHGCWFHKTSSKRDVHYHITVPTAHNKWIIYALNSTVQRCSGLVRASCSPLEVGGHLLHPFKTKVLGKFSKNVQMGISYALRVQSGTPDGDGKMHVTLRPNVTKYWINMSSNLRSFSYSQCARFSAWIGGWGRACST